MGIGGTGHERVSLTCRCLRCLLCELHSLDETTDFFRLLEVPLLELMKFYILLVMRVYCQHVICR